MSPAMCRGAPLPGLQGVSPCRGFSAPLSSGSRGAGGVALAVFRATPCRGARGVSPHFALLFLLTPGVWGCPPLMSCMACEPPVDDDDLARDEMHALHEAEHRLRHVLGGGAALQRRRLGAPRHQPLV